MTHQVLKLAVAGAIIALTAVGPPARADEMVQNLGPVGANDTILATFGNKCVIAFFERDNGRCAVNAVVFEKADADTGMTTAARIRVSLNPREMVHIDSSDNQTLHLQCGDNAKTLAVVTNNLQVASKRRTRKKG
jgi:hypothetical protein